MSGPEERIPGVRDEYDSTDGVWNYMLDRSGSENRIYFEQHDAWVHEGDYSAAYTAWSNENGKYKTDTEYVAYVYDYCLKYGLVHYTVWDNVFEEGFVDALG